MYKDVKKQRQAVREATRRYRANLRAKLKGITPVSLNDSITQDGDTQDVIPLAPGQYKAGDSIESIMPDDYEEPKPQSHNPMMVGYVPPKG